MSEKTFGTIVMADKRLLRLSATLLLTGEGLSAVLQFPHPAGGPTYEATFENYAASGNWAAIHLAQFIASAVLLAGLLVLFFALNVSEGMPHWVGFFGAVSAGVALALTGVLYAVDGVALKQAVDAWASAPAAEKETRLASAETIRWLEWGINSYWNFMQGLALLLYATVIVWTARVSRLIGLLMAVSGLAFIALGWLTGTHGFTPANTLPTYVGHGLNDVWMIWLLIIAWRKNRSQRHKP